MKRNVALLIGVLLVALLVPPILSRAIGSSDTVPSVVALSEPNDPSADPVGPEAGGAFVVVYDPPPAGILQIPGVPSHRGDTDWEVVDDDPDHDGEAATTAEPGGEPISDSEDDVEGDDRGGDGAIAGVDDDDGDGVETDVDDDDGVDDDDQEERVGDDDGG